MVLKYTQIFGGLHHNCPITGHCSSVNQEQSGHPADVADDATKSIFYLQTKNVGKSIINFKCFFSFSEVVSRLLSKREEIFK